MERLETELEEIVIVLEGGESFKVVYKRTFTRSDGLPMLYIKAKSSNYYVHIECIIKGEDLKCYTKLTENAKNKHSHKDEIIGWDNSNFVDNEMLKCEKRIGKLWLENDMLNKKYGMSLEVLCKVLDNIETEERYEEKEIRGISILEAVSDTRRWKHIAEDLETEEARYMKLLESKKLERE